MSSTINFRTATATATATLAPAPRREAAPVSHAGSARRTDFGPKGPRQTKGPGRPQRRRIGVGIAAVLAATGIVAIVQQAGTESSQPTAPAVVVSAVDTSRGPNVDLAPGWTPTATRLAPAVKAGPNADLAPNWAEGQTTAAPSVNAGPNADLAPNWAEGQTTAAPSVNAGPNADLAPNWAEGQTTAAPSVNAGPNADLAPNWAND